MLLSNSNAIETGGYPIQNSLRFQSASSQYLSRTPASATNQKTFTISFWVKRGALTGDNTIFTTRALGTSSPNFFIGFDNSTNILSLNASTLTLYTAQVFRDPSSWYHVVYAIDTTQATASNRIKLYINGAQVTSLGTTSYPSLNADTGVNSTTPAWIGVVTNGAGSLSQYFDGYLSEFILVDGQALTPSSFGETNALTGQWIAKKYTGTYGTNGFYLPFSNGTSTTTLGADSSGNGNNWTLTNFTRSAGVSDCWMIDVPSGNSGASATQPSSNYAVMNPLFRNASLISDGNLHFNKSTTGWASSQGTMPLPASKTYFEATAVLAGGANTGVYIGIATASAAQDTYQVANQWSFGGSGGTLRFYNQTTQTPNPSGSTSAGDIFQVAYDGATGNLWFGKNNTWYDSSNGTTGNPSTGANPTMTLTAGTEVFPCAICYANALKFTFGQRSFAYTPPTGFKALCTANLPAATIKQGNQYMDATLYAGNNTARSITNAAGFAPDLVWIKDRTNTASHSIYDAVRGVLNNLSSNTTGAEASYVNTLTAFNSNGFSLGIDTTYQIVNYSASNYVAWQWDAGSSTVTNTNGTISSQVRANATAGVSVVTYTGTGASSATIGHGLGVAPSMFILKARSSGTYNWQVYHKNANASPQSGSLFLNGTAAFTSDTSMWSNTAPTSSVITLSNGGDIVVTNNNTTTYVAYCFAEIAGFSKFGSYTGNGSADGVFVYTGFRPKFLLVKRTDTVESWNIVDTSRNEYNQAGANLYPNLSNAESTNNSCDIVSNGIKLRNTWAGANASGGTYIYMAFAENPFAQANAR